PTEDFQSHALRQDYDGNWVGQLSEKQIGIGAVYKLSAGDAETREYSVRVRTETHVKKHEVIYDHPPYRKPPRTTASTFPNPTATHPIIAGPRGTQAQLIVHPSRAVKTAVIEMDIAGKQRSTDMQRHGQQAFAYQWMLEQPGRFRILLTAADGEPNVDRDWRPMSIEPDDAPAVVLTSPVRDVSLPKNAALEIEGYATSRVGVKRVTLHVRIVGADASRKLAPIRFRPGVSFQRDDGTYPNEIAYLDVVPLDQLKNERGTIILPEIGDEIEVWLEAIDAADYHNGAGNVARTAPPNRKVKIAETPTDPNAAREQLAKNQAAQARKKSFDRQQDQSRSEEKKGASNSGGPNQPSPEQQLDQVKKDNQGIDDKIKQALDQQKQNQGRGSAKEREQPDAKAKDGPSGSSDAPQPQPKDTPNKDDAGANKDQGKGAGGAGQPRDNGDPSPKKDNASKGDRKDGPMSPQASAKDAGPMGMPMPVGGAKDAGPMGMNTPMPAEPKDQTSEAGAPMASAKDSPAPAPSTPMQASAKGIDQNGPETSPKDAATPMGGPPEATSKAGMMPDAASDPKTGPNPQAADSNTGAGTARSDDAKSQKREPSLSDLAKAIEQLPEPNARGDEAGAIVAGIAKNAADPRVRDIAKEALKQNGRDAKSGKQEKKGPNPFGTLGTSPGMSDEVKAIAANREFISRIHQLQFDDWRKLVTPDLLKRAGVSEADWQKRLKSNQQYRELVRELNAKLFKEAAQKELRGAATVGGAYRPEAANSQSTLEATGRAPRPAVFQDAERRYSEKR
ncbi:MAG: hypothetical protein HYR84_07465, partial [Planctomycetes bacterium]|nr:hypothetical protein [Planctomycetota bacterium]